MRAGLRRTTTIAALGASMSLLLAAGAAADAPAKTGWWNAASAGAVALPQPTTAADDLHISQGPGAPAAIAAVSYDLFAGAVTGALLSLTVVPDSAVGTVDVVACPTKDASWKAGGNQGWDSAPAYDCEKGARGLASADGTKLVFNLSAAQLLPTGGYSLAIVPAEGALPFSVDVARPDATSLTPELAAEQPEAPAPAAPPPPPAGTSGSAPMSTGTAPPPPALDAPAPAVLPQAAPAPVAAAPPVPPVVQTLPARAAVPISNRDRYAAGTLLALLAGALVWAFQQPSTTPRLIGGLARKTGQVPVPIDRRPRGIGRFATLRTAPARRLV